MCADRNTKIRASQILDATITKVDLDATGETEGFVLTVQADGSLDFENLNLNRTNDNIMLNAFRIAINGSLTQFNMIDGIVDEYEDESGIDNPNSTNESYDSTDDFYEPVADTDLKLILTLEGTDEDTTTTDTALGNTVSLNNGAKLDDAAPTGPKFNSTTSLFLDGVNDHISVADGSGSDFDFIASNADDWTVDLWVNPATVSGQQGFVSQLVDNLNRWTLHSSGSQVRFLAYDNSGSSFINSGLGGTLVVNTWHHIALCKVGNEYGVYFNGSQIGYDLENATRTYVAPLSIGFQASNIDSEHFSGYMEQVRISKSNIFSATPVSGKTDTITIPTSAVAARLDMTLISESFTAEAQPDNARIVLFEEDIDSVTINTDIKASISRDGGTTFTQVTLSDDGDYQLNRRVLTASVDISSQPVGTSMEYKIETLNSKGLKVHGAALSWD